MDLIEDAVAKSYEISIGRRLEPAKTEGKDARAVNRVVRWCDDDSVEYEADSQQGEKLSATSWVEGANSFATPGGLESAADVANDNELATGSDTAYRGLAAIAN